MKNKIGIFIIGLLLISTSGCSRQHNSEKSFEAVSSIEKNSDDLFHFGAKLKISIDSVGRNSNYHNMVNYAGSPYLALVNTRLNAIELYPIEENTSALFKRVFFDVEGPEGIGLLNGFAWINEDSIYTISSPSNGNIISLVNAEGKWLKTIVRKAYTEYYQLGVHNYAPVYYSDGKLFAMRSNHLYIDKEWEKAVSEQAQVEYVVNAETGEQIEFPTPVSEAAHKIAYIYFRSKGEGEQMVYSCRYDHYIYTRDFNAPTTTTYTGTYLAKSRFIGEIQPRPDGQEGDFWTQNTGAYHGIFYDQYREVYYRIVQAPLEYKSDPITGQRIDLYNEMPMSIIVMDKEFNILGEQLFPAKTYNYLKSRGVFIHPKGLYINLNNPFNREVSEDELVFQLLELKPEVLAKRAE